MKVGAEPKRMVILAVLVVLAGYFLYSNLSSGAPNASRGGTPAETSAPVRTDLPPDFAGPAPRAESRAAAQSSLQDFKPSLKSKRAGLQGDLSSIDATLRLDLLARLEEVKMQGGNRSLFEFSAAPAPPEPKVIPRAKIQTVRLPPPPPPPPAPEKKLPPPPIPLKFFGYSTAYKQNIRRGFFMDGDQILVGSEGDVLKKRYRVVRIGVNSVVMEDLEFKAEQTLPLEPQVG